MKQTLTLTNSKTKMIVIDAMFLAILTIMTFVPYLGFIEIIPTISFTLLHIPVLLGAYLFGYKRGLLYSFYFGLLSLIKALTMPAGILDPLFIYPQISIIPRVLFGLISGLVFDLIKKLKSKKSRVTLIAISSFLLTLLHTFLVLGSLIIFFKDDVLGASPSSNKSIFITIFTLIQFGAIFEASLSSIALLSFSPLYEKRFRNIDDRFERVVEKESKDNREI